MVVGLPYLSEKYSHPLEACDKILQRIVAKLNASSNIEAIGVITGSGHSVEYQEEIVQLKNGEYQIQSWLGPHRQKLSKIKTVRLNIDLRQELKNLKNGDFKLQSLLNKNPDFRTGKEFHRISFLYAAIKNENSTWLAFPRQIQDGLYADNVLNRICQAFEFAFYGQCAFNLLDYAQAQLELETIKDWPEYTVREGIELSWQAIEHIPISAHPTVSLIQDLKRKEIELPPDVVLGVYAIGLLFPESRELGCVIDWPEREGKKVQVSLSYLNFDIDNPLVQDLRAYQAKYSQQWMIVK
jgi:hypothetical protein